MNEEKKRIFFLLSPPALYMLLFFVIPVGIMASYAFRQGAFDDARYIFTLDHFKVFFSTSSYHRLLFRSVFQALITALFSIILAYPLAYFLAFKAGRHKVLFMTLLLIPAWTAWLLRVLAWKLLLDSTGLLNLFLLSSGFISEAAPYLMYSGTAVVITLVYIYAPFAALPIFSALESVDRHMIEASEDLGAGRLKTFFHITLPLSFPGVVAAFFFVFIPTLGEWVTPSLVGGARGIMYGNLIQEQFVRTLNWPLGALMSVILLLLIVPALFFFIRISRVSEYAPV
jgi:spermidine/putrescine transport system permease protein